MRRAFPIAAVLVLSALVPGPAAATSPSPYAGNWAFYTTPTQQGQHPCGPSEALGQEREQGEITIREDGTSSMPGDASGYGLSIGVDANGSVSLTLRPNVDGCPAASGSGTCASTGECNGAITADDGGAATFRLVHRFGGSQYAGDWAFFFKATSAGTDVCGPSPEELGQESSWSIHVDSWGAFDMNTEKDQSIHGQISSEGNVTLQDTSPSHSSGQCGRASGSGTCPSTSHCEGTGGRGSTITSAWRLERVGGGPTGTQDGTTTSPSWDSGGGTDDAAATLVTVERILDLPPHGSTTVDLSDRATVMIEAGQDGAGIQLRGTAASDPSRLADPRPAINDGDFHGSRYLQFEETNATGTISRVTITVDLRTLDVPHGFDDPGALRFYYWTGARWAFLDGGTIAGEGEPDLHVLGQQVDLANGRMTITVDHLSSYAISVRDFQDVRGFDHAGEGPRIPAPSAFTALAALALSAAFARRSRSP